MAEQQVHLIALRLLRLLTLVSAVVVLVGYSQVFPRQSQSRKKDTSGLWRAHVEEIFDCTVWIEEGCPHSSIDLSSWKAHALHVLDGGFPLGAKGKGRGIVEISGFGGR